MKIMMVDIEKALVWIKSNTNAVSVDIDISEPKMFIKTIDKYDKICEVTIFDEKVRSTPTITSTDRLR